MDKWDETDVSDSKNKEKIDEWYEKMNREFMEDSKNHDFSLSEEWDRDFKEVIYKSGKKKKRRKLLYIAASVVLILLAGLGVCKKEAIADGLEEIFKNKSSNADSDFENYSTKEEIIDAKEENNDTLYFQNKTLDVVYAKIRSFLKRPIFQIEDTLGEYEIEDAFYGNEFGIVALKLTTSEGKIFVSQREVLDNDGTSSKIDSNSILVWNENLQQNIVINQSIQDESYTFSIQKGYAVFNFNGYISMQQCIEIAKNVSFK